MFSFFYTLNIIFVHHDKFISYTKLPTESKFSIRCEFYLYNYQLEVVFDVPPVTLQYSIRPFSLYITALISQDNTLFTRVCAYTEPICCHNVNT